jgi:hypothetical protein
MTVRLDNTGRLQLPNGPRRVMVSLARDPPCGEPWQERLQQP